MSASSTGISIGSARARLLPVTLGGVLGLLASLAMGLAVELLSGPLLDFGPDVIGAVVMFLAVGLLTWHAWWMQQHARAIRDRSSSASTRRAPAATLDSRTDRVHRCLSGRRRDRALSLGHHGRGHMAAGWGGVAGGVAGVAVAALLGWVVFRGGKRISLPRFFAATSLLILFLAAGLLSTGVGRLQGLGLLPMSGALWDTSWLLSDGSLVGSFLTGLIGYRARPSLLEVLAYWAYLISVGTLLFRRRPPTTPAIVPVDAHRVAPSDIERRHTGSVSRGPTHSP